MMQRLSGKYNIKNKAFFDSSINAYRYSDAEYDVVLTGMVMIDEKINDGKLIVEKFKKHQQDITKNIVGIYLLLVVDKINLELYVFQDISSSPLTLYYTVKDDILYFSTSLKNLLLESKVGRQFNDNGVVEFLQKGFVDGETTLLKDVNKIALFHSLKVAEGSVLQIPVEYRLEKFSIEESASLWQDTLKKSIDDSVRGIDNYCMALSSGYDSNYIAHYINEKTKRQVQAFCVGGANGPNEIPIVEDNLSDYKNISLNSSITNSSTLQCLPDIVWRLEGTVYEIGVFLQYELARMVNANGYVDILCGECADQILNKDFRIVDSNILKSSEQMAVHDRVRFVQTDAFLMILKKNGVMQNSFGITTHYPYLDINFINIANSLKELNGYDKRFHKAICFQELSEKVKSHLEKKPGTTHAISLFHDMNDVCSFYKSVESTMIYKNYSSKVSHKPFTSISNRFLLKIKIKKFLNYHYNEQFINQFLLENEETKIRTYLYYAYLDIFEKLFVSGKYDNIMTNNGIDVRLDELHPIIKK